VTANIWSYLVDYPKLQDKIIYKFGLRPKIIWTIRFYPQLHNKKVTIYCGYRYNFYILV